MVATEEAPLIEWIDERGEPIDQDFTVGPVDPTEAIRDAAGWVRHQVEHAQEIVEHAQEMKAASGPRLGVKQVPERRGTDEEVLKPLLIRPATSLSLAAGDALFAEPLGRVVVEVDSRRSDNAWTSWSAMVTTGVCRRRDARLAIGPSPSGNLTIIHLVPTKPARFHTGGFVRAGVPAVELFAERLRSLARSYCSSSARSRSTIRS